MNADERRYKDLTEKIIGCIYAVANELGAGFLEKVYENALYLELQAAGLSVAQQQAVAVRYRGQVVGEYIADLIVEGVVIIELKAVKNLDEVHSAQCINYLRATNMKICLLVNFGNPKTQIKRIVHQF